MKKVNKIQKRIFLLLVFSAFLNSAFGQMGYKLGIMAGTNLSMAETEAPVYEFTREGLKMGPSWGYKAGVLFHFGFRGMYAGDFSLRTGMVFTTNHYMVLFQNDQLDYRLRIKNYYSEVPIVLNMRKYIGERAFIKMYGGFALRFVPPQEVGDQKYYRTDPFHITGISYFSQRNRIITGKAVMGINMEWEYEDGKVFGAGISYHAGFHQVTSGQFRYDLINTEYDRMVMNEGMDINFDASYLSLDIVYFLPEIKGFCPRFNNKRKDKVKLHSFQFN